MYRLMPKLDDTGSYVEKLASIIADNNLASLTIARMEVPCCAGLTAIVEQAREASGKSQPVKEVIIGIEGGEVQSQRVI